MINSKRFSDPSLKENMPPLTALPELFAQDWQKSLNTEGRIRLLSKLMLSSSFPQKEEFSSLLRAGLSASQNAQIERLAIPLNKT